MDKRQKQKVNERRDRTKCKDNCKEFNSKNVYAKKKGRMKYKNVCIVINVTKHTSKERKKEREKHKQKSQKSHFKCGGKMIK